ncbi:hypothetical protein GGI16_004923 [Coemansia sp. S142-1]|nr:hypothetical protein GGI16_004923 [Coemansia sp. S142-1]
MSEMALASPLFPELSALASPEPTLLPSSHSPPSAITTTVWLSPSNTYLPTPCICPVNTLVITPAAVSAATPVALGSQGSCTYGVPIVALVASLVALNIGVLAWIWRRISKCPALKSKSNCSC